MNPTVSVIVPCRNEQDHIERCIRSILAQETLPGGLEIIVAEGMSEDRTRTVLKRLAEEDARLRVIDSPGRTAPCGRNVGILNARGKYIAILDAHTEYASNYIRRCVELLGEHPEVCCTGGPITSRGWGTFGQATAVAMSHPMGIGNAKHRFPNYEGYAEGACFPVFRREIFDKVGLFDEELVRNQDDDFNYRVSRVGGKVFLSPSAGCTYYVRESPSQLFWQYCQYGYWRVAVLLKHRLPASVRQLVPVAFLSLMSALLVVGLFLPGRWRLVSVALPTLYAAMLFGAAAGVMVRRGLRTALLFPLCAAIMHAAYATGFLWGMFGLARRTESRRMGALTRGRRSDAALNHKA